MNAPLPSRIARSVAAAFGRAVRPLPVERPAFVPLELLAARPDLWVGLLWHAMAKTERGYRKPSLKRRPPKGASHWRGERRPDKVASAERAARSPVFIGRLNYRRSEGIA